MQNSFLLCRFLLLLGKDGPKCFDKHFKPFLLCFLPEIFCPATFRLEPLHGRVFYIRDLLCPDTGFLGADDTILRAEGQIFQQQRTAVHDLTDLFNPLVVLRGEVHVVGRMGIQQNLLGYLPDVPAVEVEGAFREAFLLPRIESMDSGGADLLDFPDVLKRSGFLLYLPGIAPADVVRNDAGRPLGIPQQLPRFIANQKRLFSHIRTPPSPDLRSTRR